MDVSTHTGGELDLEEGRREMVCRPQVMHYIVG